MAGRPSKPSPDIFLLALDRLNQQLQQSEPPIQPSQCLVFEDSTAGVEAGLRAEMRVVWVPHPGLREVYKGREDFVLCGRSDCLDDSVNRTTNPIMLTHESKNGEYGRRAEMILSLEHFPLQKFGIAIDPFNTNHLAE
jgi:pseudouridine-5'-monophosphatase